MGVFVYKVEPKRSILSFFSINSILIFLNVFLFIIFSIILSFNWLPLDFIAIKPSNILGGSFLWTFFTSMFMHSGFFHLFANMLSLMFIGGLVEKIIGRKRYLWFYLSSGIFASLFFVLMSFIFQTDLNVYAVGASGAIFSLVGLLVLVTPNLPVYLMFIPIPIKMKYAGPGLLFLLWIISIGGNIPIGNTAHLGGLIVGIAYGIVLKLKFPQKTDWIKNRFS